MKSLGLIAQIITVGLAGVLVWFYVLPTFDDISVMQNDIGEYQVLRQKVEQVNTDLARHVSTIESLSATDRERVTTYMPPFIDEMGVMRDLQYVVSLAGVVLKDISYTGEVSATEDEELSESVATTFPYAYEFTMTVEGTYGQVKDWLSLLEQNAYPLEVRLLEISPLEGGFLGVDVTLVTYAESSVVQSANEDEDQ